MQPLIPECLCPCALIFVLVLSWSCPGPEQPLLETALGTKAVRLVECGFLTSEPGALAQAFHADTSPPRLGACEGAALKIQLALVEVGEDLGPLEVIPGSHHHPSSLHQPGSFVSPMMDERSHQRGQRVAQDLGHAENAQGDAEYARQTADDVAEPPVLAHRFLVSPGDVTIYWSTVQHRGSANVGNHSRPTFHIAVIGDGAVPTGMPYTVMVDDLLAKYGTRTWGRVSSPSLLVGETL